MTTLASIRSDLATALNTVAGLTAYERVPGQIDPPAAVIAPDSVDYETTFEHGATYRLPVQVLVQLGDWDDAQIELDALVDHDGTATTAINDSTTVEARVIGMESYGLTAFAGLDYLGAQLIVEVIV